MSETAERLSAVQSAAYQFVDTMVPRADGMQNGVYPWWHGWALRSAFEAGAKFASDAFAERDRRIHKLCVETRQRITDHPHAHNLARAILELYKET